MSRILRLLLVLTMTLALAGCSPLGGGTMKITAYLADSAGLFVGNDVGILGVPVGKVASITPDGTRVKVEMEVDSDQPVPADAGAVVVARSVATDRYVELTPVFHQGARLRDGDVIPEGRTRTPVDFDQVLGALNDFATGLAGSKESRNAVRRFLGTASATLDGKGTDLNRTITSLGGAVSSVAGQRGNIVGTIKSLDKLTGTVAANEKTVRRFINQVSEASELLADERENFRTALRSLSNAVDVVAQFAVANKAYIVKTVNNSTDVMKLVLSKREQLTEILEVMPLALQNIMRATKDGKLQTRLNPLALAPLSDQLTTVCNALPLELCQNLGTSPLGLTQLLELLAGALKR